MQKCGIPQLNIIGCIVCLFGTRLVTSGIELCSAANDNAVDVWCSVERLRVCNASRKLCQFRFTGYVR